MERDGVLVCAGERVVARPEIITSALTGYFLALDFGKVR